MKYIKLEPVTSIIDEPFRLTPEKDSTDLIELVKLLLWNIPQTKITMKDAEMVLRFHIKSREMTNGVLSLEDEEYGWLMPLVDELAPKVFMAHAIMIKRSLENLVDEKTIKALKKEAKEE